MTAPKQTARDRRLTHGCVRRAIATEAPLLATGLGRYAESEGLSWEQLARSLGGTPAGLDQVALCRPPRPDRFEEDVAAIAGDYVDAGRLLPVLRRLQVLGAFHGFPQAQRRVQPGAGDAQGMLLAARDRGESPDGIEASPAEEQGERATDEEGQQDR